MIKKPMMVMVSLLVCLQTLAYGGALSLTGSTDKPAVSYQPGEPMTFSLKLEQDGKPVVGTKLSWERTGDDKKSEKGEAISGEKPLAIVTSCDQPGFVRLVVTALDEAGKPILKSSNKWDRVLFEGGAGVQPEKLESIPEPADFDAYWERQKAELAKTPMKVLEMKPVSGKVAGVDTFDVKIACAGGMPVSGYFSKRHDAAPKSSSARLEFNGYSVISARRNDGAAGTASNSVLVLAINVHGIENGREDAYYNNLKETTLKGYAFNLKENSQPETAFFNGMTLRVLRALEFLKAQPEWNGKVLVVAGGSQGGLQSLSAAGLDPDVTRCEAYKPWCCDLGGPSLGRLSGWRPAYTNALGYFDPVNHAKRIRCETFITAGLGDYTCPPSGVSVLYNHIRAPKTIEYLQGAAHLYTPQGAEKFRLSTVRK